MKHGANVSLLSPQGYDALMLAVLHAGNNLWWLPRANGYLAMAQASIVAIEILRHKMRTNNFQIVCNSSKTELTLYHLAASRGLVKFIKEIFKNKNLHQLDINCPNRDGITPMYLAKIFSNLLEKDTYNPWVEVVRFIENQGGEMQYPSRDAEYNVIYNRLYGWIPKNFELKVRPDIRGFVVGLLSTYSYWQTNSMRCKLDSLNMTNWTEIGTVGSTRGLSMELTRQLKILLRHCCLWKLVPCALEDIDLCKEKGKRESSLFSTYNRYRKVLPRKSLKINVERAHKRLFYLMRMWHENVFENFACFKTVFNTYGPHFVDQRRWKQLIEQYEGSTPLWYLNQICFAFEHAFQLHLLHYLQDANYTTFGMLYNEYPRFLRERMGWMADRLPGYSGSWPLDFLVKFSLGFYSHYDYLKVLNVGLEPNTHIPLYSDKTRQVLLRAMEKMELKRKSRKRDKT